MTAMPLKITRKHRRGQGLVEYALILALVALVAILAIGLIGLASKRGYGVVAGAVGVKRNADAAPEGGWYLYFEPNQPAQCGTWNGDSILYGEYHSNIDPQYLSISTEGGFVTTGTGLDAHAGQGSIAADLYDINFHVSVGTSDNSKCPRSLVVQSDQAHGGLTVVYPIEQKDWTP